MHGCCYSGSVRASCLVQRVCAAMQMVVSLLSTIAVVPSTFSSQTGASFTSLDREVLLILGTWLDHISVL